MLARPFDSSNSSTIAATPHFPPLHMSSGLEWPVEAVVDQEALGRGVRWALGIEGVAAFGIYILWHFSVILWHLRILVH